MRHTKSVAFCHSTDDIAQESPGGSLTQRLSTYGGLWGCEDVEELAIWNVFHENDVVRRRKDLMHVEHLSSNSSCLGEGTGEAAKKAGVRR